MNERLITRRAFLSAGIALAGLAAFSGGGILYLKEIEPSWIEITQVKLSLKRVPPAFHGFRLVQISDIHLGGWMNQEHLETVVQKVTEQKPDAVAITGDFVTGHGWSSQLPTFLGQLKETLKPLAQSFLTIGVLGNHDHWTNPYEVRKMLKEAGITELANSSMTLIRGNDRMNLAGVDDIYVGRQRLNHVVAQVGEAGAAVFLAHEPDFADESSRTGCFDLQISGHSHGGQVVIPFVGPPVLPRWGSKYPSGLYQVGDMFQYTNRGVGMTEPAVRFNCQPEITVFTLESGSVGIVG
jgi:uncharacterized protein